MTHGVTASWLELMVAEVPHEALEEHAHQLRADGVSTEQVERDIHAAVLLRTRLEQRRQRAHELATLNAIAGRLAAMHDLAPLLQEITDQARSLLGVELAYLGLFRDGRMQIEVASGVLTPQLLGLRIPLTLGLVGAVHRLREPVWTRNYAGDPTFQHDAKADSAVSAEGMGGLLGVPLVGANRMIGALFAGERQERRFSNEDVALLVALAAHASIAIDNAENTAAVHGGAARLTEANEELQRRTADLEQLLEWDKTLHQVVLRGGTVDDLVAEISRVAGVPAVFVRTEMPLAGPLARFGADAARRLTEAVQDTGDTGETGAAARDTVRVPTESGALWARPVVAAGRTLGLLVLEVTADRSSDGSVNALMERAATALAMAFTAERSAREAAVRAQDSLLVGLLTGAATGTAEVSRQARLAGLDPSARYCVLVAHPVEGAAQLRKAAESAPWPDGTVVGEHGFRTLVLAPVEDPDQLVAMWPTSLAVSATVAVAGPAATIGRLAARYAEAEQTAEVMVALGRAGTAATSDGLGIYRVLLSRTAAHEVDQLVQQTLAPLLQEEEHKTVPLVETLETYLRHHQRHAVAASELNVHVNTLYQRLATIDRLLGPGWREPDRALDLQVVLKLRSSVRLLGQAEG